MSNVTMPRDFDVPNQKVVDERKLPYRRVGNRRKILLEHVLQYKHRDDQLCQSITE